MTLQCADGRSVAAAVSDAIGDPEHPLSESVIRDKARMLLASAGYSDDAIRWIVHAALALAAGAPIADLTRFFR